MPWVCLGRNQVNEKDNHSPALSLADLEQALGLRSLAEKTNQRCDTRASIHIHSIRKRLADPDGISAKAVIDGIVKAEILEDDSPAHVKQVSFSQEKAGKDEEKTIITLEWG
jgi:hypothetical protein